MDKPLPDDVQKSYDVLAPIVGTELFWWGTVHVEGWHLRRILRHIQSQSTRTVELAQALADAAINLTICGLRDMAVKRAEEAEAERDALKERQQRESGRIPCPCDPIQCVMEYDNLRSRIASLEAQLSACTAKHYGQMAEEAKGWRPLCSRCGFGGFSTGCIHAGKLAYVSSTAGDTCTGFAERPQRGRRRVQTQGVSGD